MIADYDILHQVFVIFPDKLNKRAYIVHRFLVTSLFNPIEYIGINLLIIPEEKSPFRDSLRKHRKESNSP